MKFGIQGLLAALLATLLAVTLEAQDGQNRQRGGRGFGAFGGGMGLMGLVQMPEVQKEIKVTDDQKGLIEEMARDMREGGPRFNREEFQNLSEDQRRARFEELRKQGEERAKQAEEGLKTALEGPQFARLKELQIQREVQTQGVYAALGRPDVAEQLKLSQEQKDKVAKIRDENRPQFGGRGQGGERPDFQALAAEARTRREKANTESLAILNEEQKAAFEKMQGAKFEFPAPQFGNRGGRPGGRPQE